MKKFMLILILFIYIFSNFSVQAILSTKNQQLVFLIYNSKEIYSMSVYKNIFYTLEKNGIEIITLDLAKQDHLPMLTGYPIIGMAVEDLSELNRETAKNLKEYVRQGGKLIQFMRGYSDTLAELFSIDSKYSPTLVYLRGLRFMTDFFPGAKEINIDESYFFDDTYCYSFLTSIHPFAVSNSGMPLLWETTFGAGKTLFWNTSVLGNKAFRGFITASITNFLPVSVRKVIGKSVLFVDDFPSTSWRANLEPTYSELGVTDTGFYSKILLNDLIALSKEYSLRYSTGVVFNYNNTKTGPYSFSDWDNCIETENNGTKINVPEKILKTLLSMPQTFDVGFHGYNHIQLTFPEWLNQAYMEASLIEARKKWLSLFTTLPSFYVPPMNEIDRNGLLALSTIFPEIKTLCSVYTADPELGQNREFDIEPWDSQIVDIPRTTSGYCFNSYDRVIAYSTMEAFGIWTHFLHPDDIFSNPTNYPTFPLEWVRNQQNLPWYGEKTGQNGLYYRLKKDLDSMKTNFPWIEYSTVSDTRENILTYANDSSVPIVTTQKIEFNNTQVQRYIITLPSSMTIEENDNIKVLSSSIWNEHTRLLVEVKEKCFVYITLK
jgi:hypothetical protein